MNAETISTAYDIIFWTTFAAFILIAAVSAFSQP